MKKTIAVWVVTGLFLFGFCGAVNATTINGTYYTATDEITYNWVDISTTGTATGMGDDSHVYVSMGFNFDFYGTSYSNIDIGSNGNLHFDGNQYLGLGNVSIPGANSYGPDTLIGVLWDDLNPGAAGDVYYRTDGTAGNRRFIAQWHLVPRFPSIGNATVQAILYESTGNILLQYQDVYFGNAAYDWGASATVGVQRDTGTGLEWSYDQSVLYNGEAILFTAVPEPATMLLLGAGLIGLAGFRRKNKKS